MEPKVRKSGCIVRSALLGCSHLRLTLSPSVLQDTRLKGQKAAAQRCLLPECVFGKQWVAQEVGVCLSS